jgi:hypothetical protein
VAQAETLKALKKWNNGVVFVDKKLQQIAIGIKDVARIGLLQLDYPVAENCCFY